MPDNLDQSLQAGSVPRPCHPESRCSIRRETARQFEPEPSGIQSPAPGIRKAGAADGGNPPDKFDQEPLTGENPPAPASGKPVQQTEGKKHECPTILAMD